MILEILHIADSALPVGAAAHSFGLETMVEDGGLEPRTVEAYLRDYLTESGVLEASFVTRAYVVDDPQPLSDEFAARRIARESRDASLKMGRRFSHLVNAFWQRPPIADSLHYPVAFGCVAAQLEIPQQDAALAYLRQSIAGLISACQRLMPLGQVEASRMLWNLRPDILEAASPHEEAGCFTPLVELASARHGSLETRLFIS